MSNLKFSMVNERKLFEIPDAVCEEMLVKGTAALAECYPKAGGENGFAVAVLTSQGNIYTGASYRSDTATLTMHSEAVALAHAAQHGEKEIIAITGPNCHICKQLIWESSLNSGIEVQVIMKEEGQLKKVPISQMMPYPWPAKKQS